MTNDYDNRTSERIKMHFRLFFEFCIFLYLFHSSSGEETYENSANICSRCGCTDDAQIFTIDCSNVNLSRMLAMYPAQTPKIRAVFTGNDFMQLGKLPPTESEVEVVLSGCNIHSLDPAVFETAINTRLVDLSHNSLVSEELRADRFRGPFVENKPTAIAIEDLNLAYNQIHSLHKDVFEFLPNLTRLNLEGNDFRVLDAHTQLALVSVPGLTTLNLANNELMDLVAHALEGFQKLRELDLSRNDLDFVPKSLALVGSSLEVLILDENPIFEMNNETFAELTNLIQISANNLTRLEHIDADTFALTLKLTRLSLCNNSALHVIDPRAFGAHSTIKELYLNNNSLSSLPLSLTDLSSSLAALDFQNNPLACTCDLYTIASALSRSTTRSDEGPTCSDGADPTAAPPSPVYSLSSDICEAKADSRVNGQTQNRAIAAHKTGGMIVAVIILMLASFAAISMAFSRYRRFMQARNNEQFASQVMYSPLLSAHSRA